MRRQESEVSGHPSCCAAQAWLAMIRWRRGAVTLRLSARMAHPGAPRPGTSSPWSAGPALCSLPPGGRTRAVRERFVRPPGGEEDQGAWFPGTKVPGNPGAPGPSGRGGAAPLAKRWLTLSRTTGWGCDDSSRREAWLTAKTREMRNAAALGWRIEGERDVRGHGGASRVAACPVRRRRVEARRDV